jgi:DNA-binding NarL/FixJ family response regulator
MFSLHASLEHVARAMQADVLGYLLEESASTDLITAVRAAHTDPRWGSRTD